MLRLIGMVTVIYILFQLGIVQLIAIYSMVALSMIASI